MSSGLGNAGALIPGITAMNIELVVQQVKIFAKRYFHTEHFFVKIISRGMQCAIINPLGLIHIISKIWHFSLECYSF